MLCVCVRDFAWVRVGGSLQTYVPHKTDLYGHKLLISRKKLGSSRTRVRQGFGLVDCMHWCIHMSYITHCTSSHLQGGWRGCACP